jgi:D-glycero-D-manno-heptose 1,7-bisphosphate phosphatase
VIEDEPRGTGGALYDIRKRLGSRFLIFYADVYVDINLRNFISKFMGNGVLVTHPNDHPYDSDLVEIDATGKILSFFRVTPNSIYKNLVNAALYYLSADIFSFDVWEKVDVYDLGRDVFPLLVGATDLYSYSTVEYLKDIGTPERLKKVNDDLGFGFIKSRSGSPRKAIFLDRDGVINKLNGYITSVNQIEIDTSVFEAVRLINQSSYLCIIVTNQPVVARGDISQDELHHIHNHIETQFGNNNCFFDDIIYCPHHTESGFEGEIVDLKFNCSCRKPAPGMLYYMGMKYSLELDQCFMIGDSDVDLIAAKRAGVVPIKIDSNSTDLLREIKNILGYI